jgi:hypothetical protein
VIHARRSPAAKRVPAGVLLAAFAALLLLLVIVPPPPARADSLGYNARPQPGSPNADLGYFKFDADGGATIQRVVVLTNHSDKAKTLCLAACDGAAAVFGGVGYTASNAKPKTVGAWIDMSRTSVTIPPATSVDVPFDVKVPTDVTTGDHVGGIAVWEPAAAKTSGAGSDGDKATTKITMVTRVVLSVFVTTPGPVVPELAISGVAAEARPDGMYLVIAVANKGTAITSGEGTITLPSESFQEKLNLGDMVPGASVGYPIKWKSDPAQGAHQAQVEIHYDNDTKTATWSGDVAVTKAAAKDLSDRLVPTDAQHTAASTPWLIYGLMGGLVVIVLIMGFALLRRRRPEAR